MKNFVIERSPVFIVGALISTALNLIGGIFYKIAFYVYVESVQDGKLSVICPLSHSELKIIGNKFRIAMFYICVVFIVIWSVISVLKRQSPGNYLRSVFCYYLQLVGVSYIFMALLDSKYQSTQTLSVLINMPFRNVRWVVTIITFCILLIDKKYRKTEA